MDFKLPYGLHNSQLVTIDEVADGLACDCVCPACKKPLIARKGNKNIHHFSHYKSADCNLGLESAIHLISKEILSRSKTFKSPKLFFNNGYFKIFDEKIITIENIKVEKKIGTIIPDIIIETKGKKLLIEIVVTHDISEDKLQKIKLLNMPTVVIYADKILSQLRKQNIFHLENTLFEEELIHGINYKKWIHNPKHERIKKIIKEKYSEIKPIQSFKIDYNLDFYYVDNCPLKKRMWKSGFKKGKFYAVPYENCSSCSFCLGIEEDLQIYCIGDERFQLNNIIERIRSKAQK